MLKNQINSILINQTKRRNTVFVYTILIIIIFILMLMSFNKHTNINKIKYVSFEEKSSVDYQVIYKENDFFDEKHLNSNKQYISDLIDKIDANFNYKIILEELDIEYKYTYRIEANVIVTNKDNKNIFYEKSDILLNKEEQIKSLKEVSINEKVNIDYNMYNNKIKRLVSIYNLKNAESFLNINMFINIIGTCEEFENNQQQEKVITLSIPLTENTIAIDFIDNIGDAKNNMLKCNNGSNNNFMFLILGIILMLFDLTLIILVIQFEIKTRTAETIYEKELKKILNNYGSSIQMLGSEFDCSKYQLLKIETFSDMLEISDKLRQPILMKENSKKTGAYFIIPSNTKILYVYRLNINDIKKEIDKKNI